MTISDSVKANVRAVLLSKTDGKGVLVSTFLRDYKSIIGEQLLFKNMGYTSLESFIKEIPDVCRLEYSEKEMAYKLFGISKPNTYASSFMKRAEGGTTDCEDDGSGRQRKKKTAKSDKILLNTDLNEEWVPNGRGHISLCFPNKPGNGIETKEDVDKLFSSFGEIAEINMIPQMTFVRFFDQAAAKQAVQAHGDRLGVRRADERKPDKGPRQDREPRDSGDQQKFRDNNKRSNFDSRDRSGRGDFNKENRREPNGFNKPQNFDNDEDWDDDPEPQSKPAVQQYNDKRQNRDEPKQNGGFKQNRDKHQNQGAKPHRDGNQKRDERQMNEKKDDTVLSAPRGSKEKIQVYVGNLPAEAQSELEELVSPYNHIGVRIYHQAHMKTYAFVDFMDLSEAKRMIFDLNDVALNGRNLKIRFANYHLQDTMVMEAGGHAAAKTSTQQPNQGDPSPTPKGGSIEKQFEQLAVHRGNEYQKQSSGSQIENFSRTVSNDYATCGSGSKGAGGNQGKLRKDSGRSSTTSSSATSSSPQKMPPLENVDGRNGYGDNDMPELEDIQPRGRDQRGRGRKPQQRGQDMDMPPLEPAQLPMSPPMPTLENIAPRSQPGNQQYPQNNLGGYPGGYQSKSTGGQYEGGYQSKSTGGQYEGGYQSKSSGPHYEGGYESRSSGPHYEGGYAGEYQSAGLQYEGGYQSMGEGPGGDAGYRGEMRGPQLQEPAEPVQLFLGNFPYGTKHEDLMMILGPYGVTHLTIMNQEVKNRSTYAFATCCDMAHAEHAIAELDQFFFRGRRLTLALANPVSHQAPCQAQSVTSSDTSLHLSGASPLANITCTVGGETGRQVHLEDSFANPTVTSTPYQNNQQYGRDRPPRQDRNPNQPYPTDYQGPPRTSKYGEGGLSVKTDFNYRRMTCVLKDYGMMVSKLRGEDRFEYMPGETLMVMITHVENDKVFWGQVVKDSRGQNPDLQQLVSITVNLQQEDSKYMNIRSLGRCTAKYNDEWFRAWCMHISNRDGHEQCDVLYVDYGNTQLLPKSEVFLTQTSKNVWAIPPIARPFKLVDHRFDLDSLTNTLQVIEIVEPGCAMNNFVTTGIGKFEQ